MATDRDDAPLPGGTYKGFSGPLNSEPPPRSPSRKLLIGGIAAAVVAGLAFGLIARPNFGDDSRARQPMKAAEHGASPFEIEINAPRMDPVPKAVGKLEVLPPDLARAAEARAEEARVAEAPEPEPVRVAPTPADRASPETMEPRPRYARLQERPSFDCRDARSRSEQMVCGDPELAAADRHLARAYSRAVAAGVPQRELRAEQDDWLAIRDDAARYSPDAVASVYDQRIDELEALAEDRF